MPDLDERPERALSIRSQMKESDAKLKKYRQLLEAQFDLDVVGEWIAEVERERKKLKRQLGARPKNQALTKFEIAVYDELGVSLTYHPEQR